MKNVRSHRGLQATDIFRINDIGLRLVQRMILLSAFYITKWYRADSTYGKSIHRDHLRANYPSNHPAIQPLHHSTLLLKYPHSSLGQRRYQSPAGPAIVKKRSRSISSSCRGSFLTCRQTSAPMEETSCHFILFLRTRSDTIAEKLPSTSGNTSSLYLSQAIS